MNRTQHRLVEGTVVDVSGKFYKNEKLFFNFQIFVSYSANERRL